MSDDLVITSLQNERIKAIRALEMRKTRKETGLFVAEGAALIISARDHGHQPVTLAHLAGSAREGVVNGLTTWARQAGADVLAVSSAVLEKIAAKDNPSNVIGVFRQRTTAPPDPACVPRDATWVLLDEVRDPGNLGTILRTVDAAGAAGVILSGTTCDPWSPECVRASMGSIFAVPIVRLERPLVLDLIASWKGDTIATVLSATTDFRRGEWSGPTLIVMGGEGPGLPDELSAACRHAVKVPMAGQLDSLNLAVATALVLYEVRRESLRL
jgi:TrmH family RNA methyltransferase